MIEIISDRYRFHKNGATALMVLRLIAVCLFFHLCLLNTSSANEPEKMVFCSINKENSRLYKISEAVLTHAFENMGIQLRFKNCPPNRIPIELNNGKIDGDTHRIYEFNSENKYPNLVRVEESIQTVNQSVFTKSEGIKVDGWKSISPYKVLYLAGIKMAEKGLELAGVPPENRLGVYDIDTAFNLLNRGRGDIVIVSPSTGQASLKKLGLTNGSIKMLHPPLVKIQLYPYMNKRHAVLAKKLAAELKKMKKNGRYNEILKNIKE